MNKCCECVNEEICKEHRGSHRYCFDPKEDIQTSECQERLMKYALDLIDRLQAQNKDLSETTHNLIIEKDALFDKAEELKAEVERSKKKVEELSEVLSDSIRIRYKEAKSEAIKEFADRLKDSFFDNGYESPDVDFDYFVDNLVKEMVGDDNA